jgi:hypothetical protein
MVTRPQRVRPIREGYGPGVWEGDTRKARNDKYDTYLVCNPVSGEYDLHHNGYRYPKLTETPEVDLEEFLTGDSMYEQLPEPEEHEDEEDPVWRHLFSVLERRVSELGRTWLAQSEFENLVFSNPAGQNKTPMSPKEILHLMEYLGYVRIERRQVFLRGGGPI